jgi:hypothetical protein
LRILARLGLLLGELALGQSSEGAVLLREDWNSGKVDAARWEIVGWPVNSTLVKLGDSDWALQFQDAAKANTYSMGIRSRCAMRCGDHLRCTFRIWRDNQPLTWTGIGGPFVNRNSPLGQSPT